MPVRSLNSSVLKWPGREEVLAAFEAWARDLFSADENIRRIGYFGSFANGTDGVGSDLDVVIVLARSDQPFFNRPAAFDTTTLPVPVDLLVYTEAEWQNMAHEERHITRSVVWTEAGRATS